MALTETGFSRRTYDEILTDKIAKAKELFGEDIETSELTPLGKFIRINAYDQALIEEEAEKIYYSIFPNTATGTSLDRLCTFAGITRNPATAAKYLVLLNGTVGATIGAGFLVGTESGVNYAIIGTAIPNYDGTVEIEDGNVVIVSGGTLAVVECVGSGSADEWDGSGEMGNVDASEIVKIVNPSADVTSVEGLRVLTKGNEVESDYSLRQRFAIARDGLGSGTEASIIAAVMRVPTVENVGIIVNEDTHSFECFVAGGEDYHKEIAEAIFNKKSIGIKTTGQISYDVEDVSGGTYTVYFSHTGEIKVYVKVAIKTSNLYEGMDGESEIQGNISTYIDSLEIGKSVVLSALYGKVHSVTGVTEVTSLLLSTDGETWETTNITPQKYEKCSCVSVAVEVVE